ncbi:Rieske 2Fe-2S domain-containing protein [Bermanella marisrubri]|uniref:Rieske (2Fe-2S) protein n=1 Tax=Bermanella marisrubri TaxID=207949 RepID=Q1N3Z7_9GAMM|nr:SRPBCC family protein [Bermanella marisrubri]EAT13068.1 Rieske (2Fe-2S) protein [Oceanobacter sp. RED65] [Bermanella marisrubri]QIZ82816.1 Rieske 2Fe-2S domain-containing protein [Bermanella marisrubri]
MDRKTEIRLIEEVLALREQGETQYAQSAVAHDIDRYVSPQWFARENEKIFTDRPIAIAAACEVPNQGDYISVQWTNGISLLIVRGDDHTVRVFANACRHRNARLVDQGERGCKRRFVCPYHAWTYDDKGNLAGAPDFDRGFSDLDKNKLGLIEFNSRVVGGIVYVCLNPNKEVPSDVLEPQMISGFEYLNLDNLRVYKSRSYKINANWKILLEGGIEAYHFNVAHKNTLAPFFLGNLSTWEGFGSRNMRMVLPKKPILEASELSEDKWDLRKMANIIYALPPGLLFLAQPDNLSIIRTIPLSAGETLIEEVLLVEQPADGSDQWSDDELKMHETNHHLVNKILMEDWVLGETIQSNMASGVVGEIHFGRFESALIWFHQEYEKLMELNEDVIARFN